MQKHGRRVESERTLDMIMLKGYIDCTLRGEAEGRVFKETERLQVE